MYKHLIYDIDGTLLDTERTGVCSLIQTVKEFLGKDISYEEGYRAFGMPSNSTAKLYGIGDAERFAEVWEVHFQELMYLVAPFDGVEEFLMAAKETGHGTGIVTSRSRYEFSYDPHLSKWRNLFDIVLCSEDTPRGKPHPDPVLAYLERTGAQASECLFLGDTVYDFQCSNGAGVDFALADWRNRGFQEIPARFKFSSRKEMMDLLRK